MARGLEFETVTKDSRRPLDRDGADHAVTIDHRCSVCFCLMVCNGLSRVRVSVRAINMCMMHAMCGCVVCVRAR